MKRDWIYKLMYFFKRGQKQYCTRCMGDKGYSYWLLNNRYAKLTEVDECLHGIKEV